MLRLRQKRRSKKFLEISIRFVDSVKFQKRTFALRKFLKNEPNRSARLFARSSHFHLNDESDEFDDQLQIRRIRHDRRNLKATEK